MSKNYIPDPLVLINAEHPLFCPVSLSCLIPVSDRYPDILMERTATAALQMRSFRSVAGALTKNSKRSGKRRSQTKESNLQENM